MTEYDVILIGDTLESLFVQQRLPAAARNVLIVRSEDQRSTADSSTESTAGAVLSASTCLGTYNGTLPLGGVLSPSRSHVMRSPHTVHPSPKPLALKYFAERTRRASEVRDGPTVGLFVDFCDSLLRARNEKEETDEGGAARVEVVSGCVEEVVEEAGVEEGGVCVRVRVRVRAGAGAGGASEETPGQASASCVASSSTVYAAKAVVVSSSSVGCGVAPVVPAWSRALELGSLAGSSSSSRRQHTGDAHVVVVGGGTGAVTRALDVLRSSPTTRVTVLMRREIVRQAYDVDQGWWGTKYLHSYAGMTAARRMEACRGARARGSAPGGLVDALMEFEREAAGRLRVLQGVDVASASASEVAGAGAGASEQSTSENAPGYVLKVVRHPGLTKVEAAKSDLGPDEVVEVACDAVEVACGSAFDVATHPVLGAVVARHGVEVLGGYPVVQEDCRVCEGSRVFVAGRGAMLAVGPCGGNMVGMRMSAERICKALEGVLAERADVDVDVDVDDDGDDYKHESKNEDSDAFDPVKRVAEWTLVDGEAVDPAAGDCPDFPLESSNGLSLLPSRGPPRPKIDPFDAVNLPVSVSNTTMLSSYAFSDDGFRLAIIMTFPEPISRDCVRIKVTRTSLEAWFVGRAGTAYHLDVPRLYGNVLPERTAVIAREDKHRVTVKLHKEKDGEWKFLKG